MDIDWDKVMAVAERYRERILSHPEVVGISTGVHRESDEIIPCIRVYLRKSVERGKLEDQKIPLQFEGILVDVIVTSDIIAFDNLSTDHVE